ncbi:MAG: tRNA (adenosine(37)-N6)-threonylcarbamoyltransferase complex dimerization subunit type 1 TsaB [Pseudomonadota bacterium]
MLLAIDTSGPDCSVCLMAANSPKPVASITETLGRGHAERLMPMLEALLEQGDCPWNDLTHIACTIGPGSFTGLRVGLATARGLALATGLPATGVGVLEAMAHPVEGPVAVAMDAKRSEVWLAVLDDRPQDVSAPRPLLAEPSAHTIDDAAKFISNAGWQVTGSGFSLLHEINSTLSLAKGGTVHPSPKIEDVARLAWNRFDTNSVLSLSALYLRAPDAKPQAVASAATPGVG